MCALQTLLIDTNVTISVLNITLDKLDLGTNLTCRAINPYIDSAPMEHTWTVDLGCKYLIAISQMSLLSPTVTSPAGIRRLFFRIHYLFGLGDLRSFVRSNYSASPWCIRTGRTAAVQRAHTSDKINIAYDG